MQKLNSFAEFSAAKAEVNTAKLQEEQDAKRSKEAKTFTSLLSEYGVTAIKELDEDQKVEFFEKLRGAKVNEATELIEEGTRGQFGKIDKKGNIVSIYTHYDSYPENVLPLIKKGYKGGKNVDAVIKGGNSSGLEATPADMNFYKDGSRNLTGSIANVDGYLQAASDDGGAEYVYLWDEANKEWLMADIYGNRELVPAFESLSVSVNEAIKVEGKRDAKKVVTVYNKIFNKQLVDFGAMSQESILGCVKYLFEQAMEDANFSREGFAISRNIKGAIKPLEIKMPGLGGHFVKIGAKTIKTILDKYYSDIANAAGWGGIGIVEGTALYLESLKQEAMGQRLHDAFRISFLGEATVVMDAMDPGSRILAKLLKKHKVTMEIVDHDGPSGWPEVELTGDRKDLEKVLASDDGWGDAGLSEYIEESNGTTTVKVKSLNESVVNEAKKLTIKDVEKSWDSVYGEDFEQEYSDAHDEIMRKYKGKITKAELAALWYNMYSEDLQSEYGGFFDSLDESVVTEASGDLKVGDSGVDYNDNVVEIVAIGRYKQIAKMFKKEMKADAEDYGFEELMVNTDYYLTKNIESPEGNVGDFAIYPVRYDMANYWGLDPLDESVVNEAEIESDEEFKEYAYGILQKAFGDDFDEAKADDVVNGILSKSDGDYGKAAGILQSSLA